VSYYKVVRSDLKYTIGKTRRAPGPRPEQIKTKMAGVLHASTSAPQAATFGHWPYRLLEVEGKPLTDPDDDGKVAFRQLTVIRELDVAECFGPNGKHVVALLRQAERMTDDQAGRLAPAGSAAWYDARYAAWYAAAGYDAGMSAAMSAGYDAAGYDAWYAARSAAMALMVADLVGQHGLEQHHIDTLLSPWVSVMGDPREEL